LAADAELGVVMIDQLAQLPGIRAAETFFELLQLHLQPPDLLEQLCLLGLALLLVLALLALVNSSLASSSSCRFHWPTCIG